MGLDRAYVIVRQIKALVDVFLWRRLIRFALLQSLEVLICVLNLRKYEKQRIIHAHVLILKKTWCVRSEEIHNIAIVERRNSSIATTPQVFAHLTIHIIQSRICEISNYF